MRRNFGRKYKPTPGLAWHARDSSVVGVPRKPQREIARIMSATPQQMERRVCAPGRRSVRDAAPKREGGRSTLFCIHCTRAFKGIMGMFRFVAIALKFRF
ncbi:hypothetical protein CDAR_276201 [Caerostris darwini]|uniref:Uncharacterized protein n=1 Tax=Caerostris darwini TaxID=1538125 RepID=A0AAV4PVJ9_9ARAC|nr:hypothetical protein CDAR_276201 [Caerostris darwini]